MTNHNRTERLYREEHLAVERHRRREHVSMPRIVPPAPVAPNERWSMDVGSDTFADGRPFRAFTVLDDLTRKWLVIAVDTHLSSAAVIAVVAERSSPIDAGCQPRWFATMGAGLQTGSSTRGPAGAGSSAGSSPRARRWRARSSRALTASCRTNVSRRIGSSTSPTPGSRTSSGGGIIAELGPITDFATPCPRVLLKHSS